MSDLITSDMVAVPMYGARPLPGTVCQADDTSGDGAMAFSKTLVAVEMSDDGPAIGIRRGDWMVVDPRNSIPCDGLYILRTREVVRVIHGRESMVFKNGSGREKEIGSKDEARQLISGRIAYACRAVSSIDDFDRRERSLVPSRD